MQLFEKMVDGYAGSAHTLIMRLAAPSIVLYRDRIRRAGGYCLCPRLKYGKGAGIFSAIAFEADSIRVRAAIDLGLAMPVDAVIHDYRTCLQPSVGTRISVPHYQFGVGSSLNDSDTHPYASVGRL